MVYGSFDRRDLYFVRRGHRRRARLQSVTMAKEMKKYRQELEKIRDNDKYLLDIVQEGKTVRIECKDVNTENVELIAEDKEG